MAAGNAVVGALRVSLGIDSAQFQAGLKKAQTGLAGFARTAGIGLAAVGVAAAAAGYAITRALKGVIDHADELAKLSQKIGVPVEALSRLEHAANLSGVSLAQLQTGFTQLTRNMSLTAMGAGGVARTAFEALGISVANADGTLRSATEIFGEVAEQFHQLEDGSQKTALAVQLFGRSGADLIPLLNAGRDGLAAMADEADRFGITVSTRAAKAAERFNDAMSKMNDILQGVIVQVMENIVPSMAALAESIVASSQQWGGLGLAIDGITWVFRQVLQFIAETIAGLDMLEAHLWSVNRAFQFIQVGDWGAAIATLNQTWVETDEIARKLKQTIHDIWNPPDLPANSGGGGGGAANFADEIAASAGIASSAISNLDHTIYDLGVIGGETFEMLSDALGRMGDGFINMFSDGIVTAQEFFTVILDGIRDIARELMNAALKQGIANLLGAFGLGGSNFGGNAIRAPSSIQHWGNFAHGGSFTVGGAGGVDSQFVGFNATPGERVSIDTPGQQGRGGVNHFHIDARGAQLGVGAEIANALDQWERNRLPDAMSRVQRNPYRRG